MTHARVLGRDERVELPESLLSSVGFAGLDSWMFFTQKVYGFPVHRIVSESDAGIDGWLAFVHVRHPIFGNYLATSPFGSYGGFGYASTAVRDALLEKARELAKDLGVEHVNVRFEAGEEAPPDGWIQDPNYSTFFVDLSSNTDELLRSFSSDHRNHVRKSLKKGFAIRFGHLELLDDAYETLVRSMHELGSPYHSRNYLRAMAEALGNALEFAVMYSAGGEPVGAGAFILHGDAATNLHANILRKFRPDYAGEFLYWSAIERYCAKGFRTFDLGRSLNGSGNEVFKLKWKPRRQTLAYWYHLPKGGPLPELNQKSPKFQLAIRVWRLLPSVVVRTLGPSLIRGIV
ncbi:MAG: GNAT family N-acetyltransferase [Anaerolineales bacterium]|nr:GNAT family N-acetyltransferase [Anaerolineales bacterium]NUQ86107.1 GNAT family N-acetyltransferase [Anaerolineales bacterium]